MTKWPYGTSEWKALRQAKLQASPLCEPCDKRGRIMCANTVDHRVSIAKGGPAFPMLSGLMSMWPVTTPRQGPWTGPVVRAWHSPAATSRACLWTRLTRSSVDQRRGIPPPRTSR